MIPKIAQACLSLLVLCVLSFASLSTMGSHICRASIDRGTRRGDHPHKVQRCIEAIDMPMEQQSSPTSPGSGWSGEVKIRLSTAIMGSL